MIKVSDSQFDSKKILQGVEEYLTDDDDAYHVESLPLERDDSESNQYAFEALKRFLERKEKDADLSRKLFASVLAIGISKKSEEEILDSILLANSQSKVLSILSKNGFVREVEEFKQVLEDVREDGESIGVEIESLRAAARFLVTYDVPYSPLDFDHDGNIILEWVLSADKVEYHEDDMFWGEGDSHFILRFISANIIEFALSSGTWSGERERMNLSGRLSHSKLASIIDMFRERIISFD